MKKHILDWIGSSYQLRIEKFEDLEFLDDFEDAFWVATTAPIYQFTCDKRLFDFLDADGNKRIKSNEIRVARRFLYNRFSNYAGINNNKRFLDIDHLNSDHKIYKTAVKLLEYREKHNRDVKIVDLRDIQIATDDEKFTTDLEELEKLILYQRWFLEICNNFISFPYLYNPQKRAMLEAGKLVVDGKVLNFNMIVRDIDIHASHSHKSGMFIMYSKITGKDEKDVFHIVTPVSHVRLGNLSEGIRGVFFDRKGKQWDAQVIKVIDNPVSLREALLIPAKKIIDLITRSANKIIRQKEDDLMKEVKSTEEVQGKVKDIAVAGSVSVAALGSSFAFITKTLSDITIYQILYSASFIFLLLFVPVLIVALLRLRSRSLSTVIEASGWALNKKMRLTMRLAKVISIKPKYDRVKFRKKRFYLRHRL